MFVALMDFCADAVYLKKKKKNTVHCCLPSPLFGGLFKAVWHVSFEYLSLLLLLKYFFFAVVVCRVGKAFVCIWYVCSFCAVVQLAAAASTAAVVLSLQYS